MFFKTVSVAVLLLTACCTLAAGPGLRGPVGEDTDRGCLYSGRCQTDVRQLGKIGTGRGVANRRFHVPDIGSPGKRLQCQVQDDYGKSCGQGARKQHYPATGEHNRVYNGRSSRENRRLPLQAVSLLPSAQVAPFNRRRRHDSYQDHIQQQKRHYRNEVIPCRTGQSYGRCPVPA